jgi:hypothetical protein
MKKKTYRNNKRLILFLLMISVTFTTGTFAFWASSVEGTSEDANGTVTIGYANGVQTAFELTYTLQDGGLLVPKGQTVNSEYDSVEEINISHSLIWKEDTDVSQLVGTKTTGKMSVSYHFLIEVEERTLDSNDYSEIYDLIHINFDPSNPIEMILDGEVETFFYSITMDEPSNQQEYNLIHNANITVFFEYRIYDNFIETTDQASGPYMTLIGDDVVYVEVSGTYRDPGVQAYNSLDETINNSWFQGEVNTWEVGTYTIQYSAYSSYDNETVSPIERTIIVVDTTAPIITIIGPETITVRKGTTYSDWGAWAIDNSTDSVTVTIEGVNEVDTNKKGTYYVTYTSIDNSGNEATAIKTVQVK